MSYWLRIMGLQTLGELTDRRDYPKVDSLFECLKELQKNGMTLNNGNVTGIIVERRLVRVHTEDKSLVFELYNASGVLLGHAYVYQE